MSRLAREIGSDFHLPDRSAISAGSGAGRVLLSKGVVLCASGRDALHAAILSLRLTPSDEVLLPSYLCEDVMIPFVERGVRVIFYGVSSCLEADWEDIRRKVCPRTKALLLIHYFGFSQSSTITFMSQTYPEISLIEDCSHALLSRRDGAWLWGGADVSVASLRKLLPLPDGGLIARRPKCVSGGAPVVFRRSLRHGLFVGCRVAAAGLKGLWLRYPFFPKRLFRRLFSWSEGLLSASPKPARMSCLSRRLLCSADLEAVIATRRRNYAYLLENLQADETVRPLFPHLEEGVCPLGFPVLATDRDGLAQALIRERIYPPVHWELPRSVDRREFAEAWSVSDRILTLPVDQRYTLEDMRRIVSVLRSYREVPTE